MNFAYKFLAPLILALAATQVASAGELAVVAKALGDALATDFGDRSLPWRDLAVFAPVAGYRSRHRCVTLAFEALASAMARAAAGG